MSHFTITLFEGHNHHFKHLILFMWDGHTVCWGDKELFFFSQSTNYVSCLPITECSSSAEFFTKQVLSCGKLFLNGSLFPDVWRTQPNLCLCLVCPCVLCSSGAPVSCWMSVYGLVSVVAFTCVWFGLVFKSLFFVQSLSVVVACFLGDVSRNTFIVPVYLCCLHLC